MYKNTIGIVTNFRFLKAHGFSIYSFEYFCFIAKHESIVHLTFPSCLKAANSTKMQELFLKMLLQRFDTLLIALKLIFNFETEAVHH